MGGLVFRRIEAEDTVREERNKKGGIEVSEEFKITAIVTGLKGECAKGHKAGDKIELSAHDSGGLCGFFYHDIFPVLMMLQFGGSLPWMEGDVIKTECPDRGNILEIELRREKKS